MKYYKRFPINTQNIYKYLSYSLSVWICSEYSVYKISGHVLSISVFKNTLWTHLSPVRRIYIGEKVYLRRDPE